MHEDVKNAFLMPDLITLSPEVCKTGSGHDWRISRRKQTPGEERKKVNLAMLD